MKKLKIKLNIKKIEVTTDWYEIYFDYQINGAELKSALYDGSYENGETPKEWKKTLESGLAMKYAMEKIVDDEDFEL